MAIPDFQTLMLPLLRLFVDGGELAEFMIDHDVAVTGVRTYELKRVDSDYFAGE